MPDQVQLRGGTEAGNDGFTGAAREVTVDTTNKTLRVHDGVTAGGYALASNSYVDDSLNLDIDTKTTNYTFVLSDVNKLIEMDSESNQTFTVPEDASVDFPLGTQINIIRVNTGEVAVSGSGAATVNATPGLNLRAQWSSATLIKRAANSWVLVGDTSA